MGADVAVANVLENNRWVIRQVTGIPDRIIGHGFASVKGTISELAALTGELVVVHDARSDDRIDPLVAEKYGLVGALAAPLIVRGQTIGVLVFRYNKPIPRFTAAQQDFVRKVTAALSIGLENARLFQELEASNKQVTSVLEGITDAFVALDSEWRYTYVNKEAERLLQRPRERLLGRNIWDVYSSAINGPFHVACHEAMRNRTMVCFEHHSGTVDKWFENRVYPSQNGISVFFHDVTERKHREQLGETLDRINTAINSTVDIDRIVRTVIDDSMKALGMEMAAVVLREDGAWVSRYLSGLPREYEGHRFSDEQVPVAIATARSRDVVTIEDMLDFPDGSLCLSRKLGARSAISVPLIVRAEVAGVLIFLSRSRQAAFPSSQLDFARKLSASVSLALDNARLFADLQTELSERVSLLDRMNTLVRASREILGAESAQDMLRTVVEAARDLTGARLAAAGHGYRDGVFRVGSTSVSPDVPQCEIRERSAQRQGGVVLEMIRTNRSVLLTDEQLRRHEGWRGLPTGHIPLRGLLGVLLRGRTGEPDGHIMVSDKSDGGEFTAEDEVLLSQLAAIASLALQHLEARSEAERRAQEAEESRRILEALMEFAPEGIAIADGSDVRIRMMSKHGRELLGRAREDVEGVSLRNQPSVWGICHTDGTTPADVETMPLVRAAQAGDAVVDEEWVITRPDGSSITALCNAGPISDADGRLIGGVLVWRDITRIKETQRELEEAYQREKHFAESLQKALAPRKPSVGSGYRTASRYKAAYDGQEIGGDFYDVFATAQGYVALVIGDVSGKGLEAASLAAAARSTVRAFAFEASSAGHALTHANRVLHSQQPWGSFVTAALAIIDLPRGSVKYASAGHPPAVIRRRSGEIEFLTIGCPPFGIDENMRYIEDEINLDPGDKIVFYTDGISEARDGANLFGTEGIADVLGRHGDGDPEVILAELLEAARKHSAGKLKDDAAVIVIERMDGGSARQAAAGGDPR